MIRQPDLKKVAAKIRDIVATHQQSVLGAQESLNAAATLFGYKNWAHYQRELATPQGDVAPSAPVACATAGLEDLPPVPRPFTLFTEVSPTVEDDEHPYWVELVIDQEFVERVHEMSLLCRTGKLQQAQAYWNIAAWQQEEAYRLRGEALVVTSTDWYLTAHDKYGLGDFETRAMSLQALRELVQAHAAHAAPGWSAFSRHGDIWLFSATGSTESLRDMLVEDGVLPDETSAADKAD